MGADVPVDHKLAQVGGPLGGPQQQRGAASRPGRTREPALWPRAGSRWPSWSRRWPRACAPSSRRLGALRRAQRCRPCVSGPPAAGTRPQPGRNLTFTRLVSKKASKLTEQTAGRLSRRDRPVDPCP
eukprot:9487883-Pyramimonas_sp.AAC.1